MKQKPLEEIVQTLKQVYHGGYGLKEDSGNICAWSVSYTHLGLRAHFYTLLTGVCALCEADSPDT